MDGGRRNPVITMDRHRDDSARGHAIEVRRCARLAGMGGERTSRRTGEVYATVPQC